MHALNQQAQGGIIIATGNITPISNIGYSKVACGKRNLYLQEILHVPNFQRNHLSIRRLCTDNNIIISFDESFVSFKN